MTHEKIILSQSINMYDWYVRFNSNEEWLDIVKQISPHNSKKPFTTSPSSMHLYKYLVIEKETNRIFYRGQYFDTTGKQEVDIKTTIRMLHNVIE